MRKLGFSQRDIDAIDREVKNAEELLSAVKKQRPSSMKLAQDRYQARVRAARDGTPIPAWARKRGS